MIVSVLICVCSIALLSVSVWQFSDIIKVYIKLIDIQSHLGVVYHHRGISINEPYFTPKPEYIGNLNPSQITKLTNYVNYSDFNVDNNGIIVRDFNGKGKTKAVKHLVLWAILLLISFVGFLISFIYVI